MTVASGNPILILILEFQVSNFSLLNFCFLLSAFPISISAFQRVSISAFAPKSVFIRVIRG